MDDDDVLECATLTQFRRPLFGAAPYFSGTNPDLRWGGYGIGGKIESALHISHIVIDSDKWKTFLSALTETRRDLSVSTKTDTPRAAADSICSDAWLRVA